MCSHARLWSVHATITRTCGLQQTYSFSADALVGLIGERKRVLMFGEARDDHDGYADFCGELGYADTTGDPHWEQWCLDWDQFHKFAQHLPFRPTRLERVFVVVRNSDDGKCFVDDNNKMFYSIPLDIGELLFEGSVHFLSPINRTGPVLRHHEYRLPGCVVLKNIDWKKQVDIVYTTDNWHTVRVTPAQYTPTQWASWNSSATNPNHAYGGNETWHFLLDIGNTPEVQLCVCYKVAGQSYWDSNFGKNYSIRRA